jgi:hypothetical protein
MRGNDEERHSVFAECQRGEFVLLAAWWLIMESKCAVVLAMLLVAVSSTAQTDETKTDTVRMSTLLSEQTGIVTVAVVVPRGKTYDVKVQFNGPVTNYKGVMGVLIGAVGQTTRTAQYATEWCYITTRERGTERILTRDIREAQSLALASKFDESWKYFLSKKAKTTPK